MNLNEIEQALGAAPKPEAPSGLKSKLNSQVNLAHEERTCEPVTSGDGPGAWLRRWWTALAPAALALVCGVVVAAQQVEIRDLKQMVQSLSRPSAELQAAAAHPPGQAENALTLADGSVTEEQEIALLQELAARLSAEVAQLEKIREENGRLRGELARPAGTELSPEDAEALAKARENAMATMCVNNLKQLGLSVKVWALDNTNIFPSHVLEMTNEMSTPKILVCPADTGRQAASDWASWTTANMSYEFLAPGASDGEDPQRVLFRCPIHGNVGLCDGSVQRGLWKTHPERFVQRNGKLYYENSGVPAQAPPAAPPSGAAAPEAPNP